MRTFAAGRRDSHGLRAVAEQGGASAGARAGRCEQMPAQEVSV